jgi:predicted acylesterase/phospholipase RssA
MSRVLFVRSGGGFPGIDIHAGIWLALDEAGIQPTALSGTSAGAIVSGIQATGCNAELATQVVKLLRDSDMRRPEPLWKFRLPWLDHIYRTDAIYNLLQEMVAETYENLRIPLAAWATRAATGKCVNVADPDISISPARACLASASIGGIFPPVIMEDGYSYIDGGVRANLPLPGNWRDYDQVWLLIGSPRPRDYSKQRGVLTHLIRNVQYLMQDQIEDVLEETAGAKNVHVIWPTMHVSAGMLHFDHQLIDLAYREAYAAIKKGGNRDAS